MATMMRQVADSFSAMDAKPKELEQFRNLQTALAEMQLPFRLPHLPSGFNTVWMLEEDGTQWRARSVDGRLALPFGSKNAVWDWIEAGHINWDSSLIDTVEDSWVTVQLADGKMLWWPEDLVPRN